MPRRKLRTPELRRQVVDAAVATLADAGIGGFTARTVAERATTSVPAVYELFGDKAGLVREVFYTGFARLAGHFDRLPETDDPRADLVRAVEEFRRFARVNPVLAEVMFSRPFADFDPGPEERAAGAATRRAVMRRVRRCVEAGVVTGDEADIAHVLLAVAQGLAMQENAGWLGTSKASRDRRWRLAVDAVLAGLAVPST